VSKLRLAVLDTDHAGVMEPHESDTLETVNIAKLQKTFAVNTFGPLLFTQALLPNIIASQDLISRW
jgi:NAD(P)-dependent dehydrogenase (short-subunit alcohol dehydrogenase family)